MIDIFLGVLAIIFVIIILIMKESENKYVAYIGITIILIAKILNQ